MRKIIIITILLIQILFLVPILFTQKFETKQTSIEENVVNNENETLDTSYDYKNYNYFKLNYIFAIIFT